MKKALVIRPLMMAINLRKPPPGLIHHSDRGSQHASHAYLALLKQHDMIVSMSRKGNCWDNAPVERFFSSLKREWTGNRLYRTRQAAIADGRESLLYRCDGNICAKQKVGNVAVQSNLYSKGNPNSAEIFLSEFENAWSKLIKKLLAGRAPKREILASLLLIQSSFFLLSNPKFSNKSNDERIDVYKQAVEGFWQEVLLSGEVPDNYIDMQKQISKTWSCHLLMSQGEAWITSDNPVLTLAVQKSYTSNYISSNNT